jgi:outer membrane protein assembly factor BamA
MPATALATAACLVAWLAPSVAHADVRDYLGRVLAEVRVELAGTPFSEPAVLELIETRVGAPLSMRHVRDSIDHLVGLGRFEDVRVFAELSRTSPDAVSLRWLLLPVRRITRVDVVGRPGIAPDAARAAIQERLGVLPASTRASEVAPLLDTLYRERGYRSASVDVRLSPGRGPEVVTMIVAIDAGPRTMIGAVSVQGESGRSPAALLAALRLEGGQPYDPRTIDARVSAFEEDLRAEGYYEADVALSPSFAADGRTVALAVTVDRGSRVRVVVAGDPLPENRVGTLIPIRQERSVDLDLLEDASRNIESFLRQQGYRAASAPYVREVAAGEMVLTFTVSRGPMHRLGSIGVTGNQAVSLAELQPLLTLPRGEPFLDSRVGVVAAAASELYRVRGFREATVRPEIVVRSPAASAPDRVVDVQLVVTEGPRTMVGQVEIEGARSVDQARIRALLGLAPGRPLYQPQVALDRQVIERLYQREGFQRVRVEPQIIAHRNADLADVRWDVREGPRTVVDHVLITGNRRTDAGLIRRELTLTQGQALGDEAVLESQRRLAALGLFRRVRIVQLPHQGAVEGPATPAGQGSVDRRDVLIDVEESPATTVAYGGGLEAGRRARAGDSGQAEDRIEVAPRGFFEVSRRNLWGKNRSISLFTRVSLRARDPAVDAVDPADAGGYGFNEYRIVGAFREPRPLDSVGDFQLTGFLEQAIRPSFNFGRRGVRAEYARRVGSAVTVSGRFAFDRTRLFDERIQPEDRLLIDRLFPRVRLATLTGSVLRDSRDDVLDPERGTVVGVDGTLAPRALLSEVGFVKTFLQAFGYRRLPGAARLTVAGGLRLGMARGFERRVERTDAGGQPILGADGSPIVDVVTDVPASERFFAGGDTSVRGFVLDRLGTPDTLNDDGFPTGGSGLAVVNLELRTAYWKGLGGVGFFDAGNVFKRSSDIRLGDLRPAAGLGVRYRSPLGPLRVDLGFNLDRRLLASGERERGTVFHISLGQAF